MTVNKTSFNLGFLNPSQPSAQRLSTGTYSLSNRSNIPFARLIGKGIDKIFTWGETVEVPPGMICTVSNASYHAGDLFMNSGCDVDNRPAAITVPFQLVNQGIWPDFGGIGANYPVDVRGAHKAFAVVNLANVSGVTNTIGVIGQRLDGSHNTFNELALFNGSGYVNYMSVATGLTVGPVPLGKKSVYGFEAPMPHTLLTVAWAVFYQGTVEGPGQWSVGDLNAYYTVEYR